jgi:hypothetical protein
VHNFWETRHLTTGCFEAGDFLDQLSKCQHFKKDLHGGVCNLDNESDYKWNSKQNLRSILCVLFNTLIPSNTKLISNSMLHVLHLRKRSHYLM